MSISVLAHVVLPSSLTSECARVDDEAIYHLFAHHVLDQELSSPGAELARDSDADVVGVRVSADDWNRFHADE